MKVLVRSERNSDIGAARRVHLLSFPSDAEANLVDRLRDQGKTVVALVAEAAHGAIVGHIVFSPVQIEHEMGLGNYVGLAPLAVLPEFRRQGCGSQLVELGLRQCAALGYHGAVVVGDPAFYGRFGFESAAARGLTDEFDAGEAFQVWERVAGSLPPSGALVRYDAEFSRLATE